MFLSYEPSPLRPNPPRRKREATWLDERCHAAIRRRLVLPHGAHPLSPVLSRDRHLRYGAPQGALRPQAGLHRIPGERVATFRRPHHLRRRELKNTLLAVRAQRASLACARAVFCFNAKLLLNMRDIPVSGLSEIRHNPTPESMDLMRSMRQILRDARESIPQIQALAFFGSRTLGRERGPHEPKSDLDVAVFYDSSDKKFTKDLDLSIFKNWELNQNRIRQLIEKIEMFFKEKLHSLGLPVRESEKSVIVIDISRESTNAYIRTLQQSLKWTGTGPNELDEARLALTTPFLLGIGNALCQHRKYILDNLENLPDGEELWKALVHSLQVIERIEAKNKRPDTPLYTKYPDTLKKAKSYFLK